MASASTAWTQIDVLSISDIHLGNAANPAEHVIHGLEQGLTYKKLKGLNILFIVGDVFDRGLTVNHKDVPHIVSWIRRLLARCAKLDITVIVLEGTPSHDRLQSQLFVAINDAADEDHKCDLRYIKEVSIEYIEKYDIQLLCIPDEKNTSDEVTYHQVKAIMQSRALEKVDFAIMHGFFEFQVPFGRSSRFHDSKSYLDMVKYLIFIGHDHTFQKFDRIIVQGSPDRQRHGMEDPKGWVRALVQRDGTYRATFETNEYAMVFKTVEVNDDLDVALDKIYSTAGELRDYAHLRIAASKGHPVFNALDTLQQDFPRIHFSKKVLDEDEVKEVVEETSDVSDYVPFTIDSSNITTIVKERMPALSAKEAEYFDSLMESVT